MSKVNQFNQIYTAEIARLVAETVTTQIRAIDDPVKLANLINGQQVKRSNIKYQIGESK